MTKKTVTPKKDKTAEKAKTTKKTTSKKQEPSLVSDNTTITLTLPWSTVYTAYQGQLKRFAKNVKSDGFRKGKVPLSLAEKMIDRNKLIQATLERVVPETYGKAIEAGSYAPLTQPDIQPKSVEWEQDWIIEAQFAQAPEVTITGYKKIVESAKKTAEKTWKERVAEQEKAKKAAAKKADSKSADTPSTDPKKEEAQKREHILYTIFKELVAEFKPAIPELLIRDHTKQELQELEQQLKQVGATIEQFLERKGQSFNDLTQELAAQTLGKLQLEFILRAIQDDLKIEVTEAAIKEEYEKLMAQYSKTKSQIPPISDSSREYIQRTLERRDLLDALTK